MADSTEGRQQRNSPRRAECLRHCFRDGGTCLFHDQQLSDMEKLDKKLRHWRIGIFSLALSMLPMTAVVAGFLVQISNNVAVLSTVTQSHMKKLDELNGHFVQILQDQGRHMHGPNP